VRLRRIRMNFRFTRYLAAIIRGGARSFSAFHPPSARSRWYTHFAQVFGHQRRAETSTAIENQGRGFVGVFRFDVAFDDTAEDANY